MGNTIPRSTCTVSASSTVAEKGETESDDSMSDAYRRKSAWMLAVSAMVLLLRRWWRLQRRLARRRGLLLVVIHLLLLLLILLPLGRIWVLHLLKLSSIL